MLIQGLWATRTSTFQGSVFALETVLVSLSVLSRLPCPGSVYYTPGAVAVSSQFEPAIDGIDVPAGVYVMRSASQHCCEMTDSKGTHFTVISNGQMTVEQADDSHTKNQENSADKNRSQSSAEPADTNGQPTPASPLTRSPVTSLVPRFFVVHADGSGIELLRQCDVAKFLARAEEDPGTAVLRAPVEGNPDATGITVLRPYSGEIVSRAFNRVCNRQPRSQGLLAGGQKAKRPWERGWVIAGVAVRLEAKSSTQGQKSRPGSSQ